MRASLSPNNSKVVRSQQQASLGCYLTDWDATDCMFMLSQLRNLSDSVLQHRVLIQSCLHPACSQCCIQCRQCRGVHAVCRWQGEVRNQDCSHSGSYEGVHHQVPESHAHTVLCQLPVQQSLYPQVAINTHWYFLPAGQDCVRLCMGFLGSS